MRFRITPISPVRNRDFGKKRELVVGQARVNMATVRVLSKEEAERMTVAEITDPPEEATIEVLWHDHVTLDKYRKMVRDHPEHELAG